MDDSKLVMPGDFIATSEEYTPGTGIYEENGGLFASQTGQLHTDYDNFQVEVKPLTNTIIEVEEGMEIIGQVTRIKESAIVLKVLAVVGLGTRCNAELEATLHVSKVSRDYVDRLRDHFRLLDIVRAGVLSASPSIQVETAYPNGGVVGAYCGECREPLGLKNEKLWCSDCQRSEHRMLSRSFGQGPT